VPVIHFALEERVADEQHAVTVAEFKWGVWFGRGGGGASAARNGDERDGKHEDFREAETIHE
jgi:hypothetical protein